MKKFLTLEQMTALMNFGIDVSPKCTGMIYSAVEGEYKLMYSDAVCEDDIIAFDLQDINELLPKEICGAYLSLELDYCSIEYYYIDYGERISWKSIDFNIEEIIDACYEMLLWVIENGYLKQSKMY